jgi:hypothetical protein
VYFTDKDKKVESEKSCEEDSIVESFLQNFDFHTDLMPKKKGRGRPKIDGNVQLKVIKKQKKPVFYK